MSNQPQAELCYGVSLMSNGEDATIPESQLCDLMDKDLGKFKIYSCGQCDSWLGHILAIKHEENYFEYVNELGKNLPLRDPSWDEKLKNFCKTNKIPFKNPQWWLLAYYG